MVFNIKYKLLFILLWVSSSMSIPSRYVLNEDEDRDTPRSAQDSDDEDPMIISKLSDRDLVSLLQKTPKQGLINVFDVDGKGRNKNKKRNSSEKKKPSRVKTQDSKQGSAFFRLDDKVVEPFDFNAGADPKYLANQKIQNLLYSQPTQNLVELYSDENDENKELLFDILTEQLKKLCCKSRKTKQKRTKPRLFEPLLNMPSSNEGKRAKDVLKYEQMFLIINDEIQSDQASDIVYVDPESLNNNSSVILLGPITTPLTDSQLQTVMNRITSELSKPEYIPLLQQLSEGKYNKDNTRLVKSLISGSNTRRYIKPHRCRTRYPLSQGPKWLICTGYLNINTPSLYD